MKGQMPITTKGTLTIAGTMQNREFLTSFVTFAPIRVLSSEEDSVSRIMSGNVTQSADGSRRMTNSILSSASSLQDSISVI